MYIYHPVSPQAKGNAISQAVRHVGVDSQWEQHFAEAHK
jgi:hypothetical protein